MASTAIIANINRTIDIAKATTTSNGSSSSTKVNKTLSIKTNIVHTIDLRKNFMRLSTPGLF